jgi:peptidoglycan/LPS O-acetylase OafA/YrhL
VGRLRARDRAGWSIGTEIWFYLLAIDRTIGELSYPVYIVHMLLASLLGAALKRWQWAMTGEQLLLLVLPVSYGIFHFVERPIDRWRQAMVARTSRRRDVLELLGHASALGNTPRRMIEVFAGPQGKMPRAA